MEKKVSVTRAREILSELVEGAQHQGEATIISRHGKAVAAIVPLEVFESWKRDRQAFFNLIRQAQAQSDLTPAEAEHLATEAVTQARTED